jgi:hypothetical protein
VRGAGRSDAEMSGAGVVAGGVKGTAAACGEAGEGGRVRDAARPLFVCLFPPFEIGLRGTRGKWWWTPWPGTSTAGRPVGFEQVR